MKLIKGDKVIVLSGKDKGQTGKIVQVFPALNKVVVDGINVVKRAYKPTPGNPKGGIKEEPKPIWASKVAILHPTKNKRGSRIGFKFTADGIKERVYKQADNKKVTQNEPTKK